MQANWIRLLHAAKELKGLETPADVARFLNESDQTVNNWKRRGVPKNKTVEISARLGCRPEWLETGAGAMAEDGDQSRRYMTHAEFDGSPFGVVEEPPPPPPPLWNLSQHPDLHQVPRVRFRLSAGVTGFAVEPESGNGKPIFFRRDWFALNSYRPEKMFAVRVSGASMEPSLWDGDLVVINTDDVMPRDGEVFAVNFEGELCIKRLRRDAGEWWATSDNADQRRFAPKRCTEDVKLIGRVVYKQSERI